MAIGIVHALGSLELEVNTVIQRHDLDPAGQEAESLYNEANFERECRKQSKAPDACHWDDSGC